MRCQARRGRRRGGVLSQAKTPARCNGLPPDEGLDTKVTGSDAPELDTPIGRTCLRGTQTRRPRRREDPDGGAEKTAGMDAGSQMTRRSSPGRGSRSEWCTIRREPPGPPARLWQNTPREGSVKAGPAPGHPRARRGPSPPCQRDACSGNRRRTRRRKEPHKLLRQVASGASSETSMTRPGGRSRPAAKLGVFDIDRSPSP